MATTVRPVSLLDRLRGRHRRADTHVFSARRIVAENCTLHVRVTGVGLAKLRLRCAEPIVWIAAKIAGVGLDVDLGAK